MENNLITQSEIKFWTGIIAVIVSLTIWGVRLEGRIDNIVSLMEDQKDKLEKLTDSENRLWKNMTNITAKVNIPLLP